MHSRRAIGAVGLLEDGHDLAQQLGVGHLAARRCLVESLIEGGAGDLQQLTAALHAVTCDLLRLDEGLYLHRVSFAKKAVARFRISTSSLSRRFSLRRSEKLPAFLGRQAVAVTGVDLSLLHPRPHRRLCQVEVPRDLADRAITVLAQLDDLGLELRGERPTGTRASSSPSSPFWTSFPGHCP